MYTPEQVAAAIDYAVLKPDATDQDILDGCKVCEKYKVASMCVRPTDVALAVSNLNPTIAVSTVIGFPHGSNYPDAKATEASMAISEGATELDMVMNVGKFLSGDYGFVRRDIEGVVDEAKYADWKVLVKVIIETCFLSNSQIKKACHLCVEAGADYVKTSTGFFAGAEPSTVAVMVSTVGRTASVKASGGIKSWDDAVGFLDQGCTRLGIGAATADILEPKFISSHLECEHCGYVPCGCGG